MKLQKFYMVKKLLKLQKKQLKKLLKKKGLGSKSSRDKKVKPDDVKKGIKLLDFLSDNNIMSSKNEARRAIANNGLKINNNLINDEKKLSTQLILEKEF